MSIKVCTWNIEESNNVVKRKAVLNCLERGRVQIAFLQEAHLNDEEHKKYLRERVGRQTRRVWLYYYTKPQNRDCCHD